MNETKELNLPSGAKTRIRKLSPIDFATIGPIPSTISAPKETGDLTDAQRDDQIRYGVAISRAAILKACGHIIVQGVTFRIVDKNFFELGRWETCIEQLDQGDAEAIINAVKEFSAIKKEAAEAAQTFPEGSQPPPVDSRPG